MRYQRPWILLALLVSLIPLGACEYAELQAILEDGVLEILPRETTLTAIGDTVQLAATFLVDGERVQPDIGDAVQWSTSNSAIAVVRSDGTVEARGNGRSIIRGTLRGQRDSVTVVVEQVPARVAVKTDSITLTSVGSTTQLHAEVFDKNGHPIADATASWQSSDPKIAEVDRDGRVVAHAEGDVDIVAMAEGATPDTVRISIKPAPAQVTRITLSPDSFNLSVGESRQVRAQAVDANGAPTSTPDLAWTSLNPEVASVDSKGIVTARATGTARITFTAACCSPDTVTVVVAQTQTAARVDVTPSSRTITALGDTVQLSARVLDESGDAVPGVEVTWTSTNPSVAEVSANGVVIARGKGTSRIIASANGATPDTVTIHVEQTPAKVTVSPTSSRMRVGETSRLSAEVSDANGSPVADPELTWTSLNPEVATVNATGRVTAVAAGTALIVVSTVCCDAADTTRITVEPGAGSGTPFFSDNFDNGRHNDANGFTWSGGRNARVSNDIARSGSYSLKFSYGPVEPDGSSHWWTEQRFSLGRRLTEVWVEYYIYYPDGTEGFGSAPMVHRNGPSSDNNKFFRLWGGGHSRYSGNKNKVGMSTNHLNNGPDGRIYFEYTARGKSGTGTFNGPGSRRWEDDRGRWIQVRMYYKHVSAPGANDGHMTLWKDGEVWIDFPNVDQEYVSAHPYWDSGYIMGYDNSGFDRTTHIYIDDVKFYDTDPGWK